MMLCEEREKDAENTFLQLNKHIQGGHAEEVRKWLEEFAPENPILRRPLSVRNPVSLTAELGNTEIFQLLTKHGFQTNSPDVGGPGYRRPKLLPLHLAAMKGHCDLVKLLVEVYNADVNQRVFHTVPLHLAVTDRQTEVVRYLLHHGASPLCLPRSFNPCQTRSPLDTAVHIGCWDIVTLMIDSLKEMDIGSFVATLNLLLQKHRKDVGFELYNKFLDINQSSQVMLPIFTNLKILRFLLEVRYPPYFDEERLNPKFKMKLHKLDNTSLRLYIDAGCPLRGKELITTLQGQRSNSFKMKTISEFASNPQQLKYLSIFRIRNCLGHVTPENIDRLPLPVLLRTMLRLDHLSRKRCDDGEDGDFNDDGDDSDDGDDTVSSCLQHRGEQ